VFEILFDLWYNNFKKRKLTVSFGNKKFAEEKALFFIEWSLFSSEKKERLGLLISIRTGIGMPYRTEKKSRHRFNSLEPCKVLNRFKIENQKNQKQILFSSEKKISCTSK